MDFQSKYVSHANSCLEEEVVCLVAHFSQKKHNPDKSMVCVSKK